MSGIVGVIANDFARSSLFTSCVWKLDMPEGWRKEMLIGGDWCSARNTLCELVLDDEEAEYLWFMDDDHAFPPGMLRKLLAHDEALVSPVCLTRVYPFAPVQYTKKISENQYLPVSFNEQGEHGLVELEVGGAAGMLIRRDVIEAIEPPWFEYTDRSEDIIFCEKAKAAGFTLYADLECRLGHITTAVVHPTVREGDWKTGLTIGRDLNLIVDTAENVVAEKPGAPASVRTWVWTLVGMLSGETHATLLLPEGVPFNWQPTPGFAPRGIFQWYCDSGGGPEPIGDPFSHYSGEEI